MSMLQNRHQSPLAQIILKLGLTDENMMEKYGLRAVHGLSLFADDHDTVLKKS